MLSLFLVVLGGCGQETARDVIRFGVPNLPETLHPLYATDAMSERIARLLYRPLVGFDEHQRPQPVLAEWEQMELRRYRLTLKPDLPSFANGSTLTAADVAATYNFVLNEANASPHRATLALIAAVRALDEHSLDIELKRPDPYLPSYLALGIVPASSVLGGRNPDETPPGNGPFEVAGGDGHTTLRLRRRNDGQLIELVAVRDPVVRVLKLLRGEIDLIQNDLPPELFAYLGKQTGIQVDTLPGTNFTYLGLNLEDPVTGDLRVRRAIAHSIDREAIARHLFRDRVELAQTLFTPQHWLGVELPGFDHDPVKAREWLKEAGYDAEHPLKLDYKTSADPFRLRLAAIIQAQLAEAGIQVQLKSYDWGTFYGDIKGGNFQLYSLTWVGLKTPDSFRYLFHSRSVPPDGANRGRYRSARVDHLIEAAETETDPDAQVPIYHELQQVLLDELPYIPLWYEDHLVARRDDVTGYRLAADGNYDGLEEITWAR